MGANGAPDGGAWPSIGGLKTASEDCLFVCVPFISWPGLAFTSRDTPIAHVLASNIYTPTKCPAGTLLPVMVYMHAGEFIFGSGFDMENLIAGQGAFGVR